MTSWVRITPCDLIGHAGLLRAKSSAPTTAMQIFRGICFRKIRLGISLVEPSDEI
jgi:hypothetical protein